jgi:nucleoside-diphosphate-sugar epimerase
MYHLAAVYDLSADEASQVAVNIDGTRNAVEFAKAIEAKRFNHVSSIAAAGLYEGVFREDMFDEAEGLHHAVLRHEARVREDRAHRVQGALERSTARRWWWATRRRARWTRSTARTTSSS